MDLKQDARLCSVPVESPSGKFISKSGVGIIFFFKALCITSGTRNFVLFLAVSCLRK